MNKKTIIIIGVISMIVVVFVSLILILIHNLDIDTTTISNTIGKIF